MNSDPYMVPRRSPDPASLPDRFAEYRLRVAFQCNWPYRHRASFRGRLREIAQMLRGMRELEAECWRMAIEKSIRRHAWKLAGR